MSNYSFKTVRWTITNLSGYICLGFVSSVDNKLISWSCEGFYLFPPPQKKNIEKRKLWLSCLESWGSFTTLKLLRMNVSKEMITIKVVIIFPHTSRLVSLNCHVRLCTVSHLFNQQRTNSSHTPASFSPLAQQISLCRSLFSPPATEVARPKQMAPLAHKEARRLTLPEVIRARGDQLPPPPPSHCILFWRLSQ